LNASYLFVDFHFNLTNDSIISNSIAFFSAKFPRENETSFFRITRRVLALFALHLIPFFNGMDNKKNGADWESQSASLIYPENRL
jgi:predicted acyltransferase